MIKWTSASHRAVAMSSSIYIKDTYNSPVIFRDKRCDKVSFQVTEETVPRNSFVLWCVEVIAENSSPSLTVMYGEFEKQSRVYSV